MALHSDVNFADPNAESKTDMAGCNFSRLGLCEVCASQNAKYSCPKCEVRTCSLDCNKIHKLELECDGRRDRTKFIPLNKFTNLDLLNDYKLLEDIGRNLETSRKTLGQRFDKGIPAYLLKLRHAAKLRKISLRFLPYKFAKRMNNSSQYQYKTDEILWHIEWIFVNADNLKLYDTKVPETQKLCILLNKYLVKQDDNSLNEKLLYYQSASLSGVQVLLKAEQKGGKKFYELEPNMTLKECLQKKLIIEYPTIHVVLQNHQCVYDIVDSDDEENMKRNVRDKSGKEIIDSIIIKDENNERSEKSLKNLLFISDCSEDEVSD